MTLMDDEQRARRWDYHRPTPETVPIFEAARANARSLAEFIDDTAPDCAEKAEALRQLEQAMFWFNAAVARGPVAESRFWTSLPVPDGAVKPRGPGGDDPAFSSPAHVDELVRNDPSREHVPFERPADAGPKPTRAELTERLLLSYRFHATPCNAGRPRESACPEPCVCPCHAWAAEQADRAEQVGPKPIVFSDDPPLEQVNDDAAWDPHSGELKPNTLTTVDAQTVDADPPKPETD